MKNVSHSLASVGFLSVVLFATGCAMQPKQEAMVPAAKTVSFEANKVFSGRIAYKPLKNPATKFDYAVTSALRNQGWLNASGSPDFYLSAFILNENIPKSGFAMTGSVSVSYSMEGPNRNTIWTKRVDTTVKKDLSDKFSGVSRAEAIVEDYVRLNISDMIQALEIKGRQLYVQREELLNQRLAAIEKQFVDSDLFSGKSYFDSCSDTMCNGYQNRLRIVSDTSTDWMAKLNGHSSSKVQRFYTTYSEYMNQSQKTQVAELIQSRMKVESQQREKSKERQETMRELPQEGKGLAF